MKRENKSWLATLFSFAAPCKGKMILSVLCSVISVGGGFLPFWCVYRILALFVEKELTVSQALFWSAAAMGGYLVKVVFFGISTVLSHLSAYNILEGLRLRIFDRLMAAPLGEVTRRRIGSLKNIIVDKVEEVEPPLAHMIPELSANLLLPAAVFVWILVFDFRMALSVFVAPALSLIPMYFLMRNYNTQYQAYMDANNRVNSVIIEYVEGIEVVKAFNQSAASYEKFAGAVSSFRDFTLAWFKSTWKLMNLTFAIMPTVLLGTLPAGLWLYEKGALDPAQLIVCILLSLSIVGPLTKVATFVNEVKSMEFSVNRAQELLQLPELPKAAEPAELRGADIRLRDVSFSYSGKEGEEVLSHVDLDIPEGSLTALVGPSGSGKTTVARLVSRFWDVSGGSISVGGTDVKQIPLLQLQQQISFVTQDNFLFDCSLKENIRLGSPSASDEEVYRAAVAACCDPFIQKLPMGYDTPAGEAGKRLSGGEKQRISIARAILKDAPVVILDEATAFSDPENEDKIQQSIVSLAKGKTLLVIAHRLSTIQNADQIVVLERGKVVDHGTQAELLRRCPLYQQMWQAHVGARHWSLGNREEELHV